MHLLFEHVGALAHQGALVAGKFAHGPEHAGEFALFAQEPHQQVFQFRGGGGRGDRLGGLRLQALELVGELLEGHGGAHGWGFEI